ncbi:hypothetical protein GCM10010177_36080 [Actinomadura citrea]|nr:hypothetical protein GCM10010177_36080 [Actinomadura citrea]
MHGLDSFVLPTPMARLMARRRPDTVLREMPGCGHWPHDDDPDAFAETVRTFLDRLNGAGTAFALRGFRASGDSSGRSHNRSPACSNGRLCGPRVCRWTPRHGDHSSGRPSSGSCSMRPMSWA